MRLISVLVVVDIYVDRRSTKKNKKKKILLHVTGCRQCEDGSMSTTRDCRGYICRHESEEGETLEVEEMT